MREVQNNQANPPTLEDLLYNHKRGVLNTINCVQVGIVQSFDSGNNTVNVKLAIKRLAVIKEDGTRIYEEKPVLAQCPIVEMYGGAGVLTMPISAGDECLVLFNDNEIDNWFLTGAESAPDTIRVHDISDGFALIGVRSLANLLSDRLENGVRLAMAESKIDLLADKIESLTDTWEHTGILQINGVTIFNGQCRGLGSGAIAIDADLVQTSGKTVSVGNGATGTFTQVTVVDGIVTGGT